MEKIQSQSRNLGVKRVLCYIVLVLLAIISLFPFYIMIINCTRSHMQIQLGFSALPGASFIRNFVNLAIDKNTDSAYWQNVLQKYGVALSSKTGNYAENYPILKGMLNSVIIATLTACFTTYFSAMTSYGIYMYNFKGKGFAFKFIMAVMMVPTQVSTLGFLRLLTKLGLMNNYIGLIVPSIAAPVVFFYMIQYMSATLPRSIVEAARVDGCNEFRTFNEIVIPIIKPAIAVQGIFAFVTAWNNYFLPALILTSREKKTIPILIAQLRNADYMKFDMAQVYMLVCIAIVPLLIGYLCMSRSIIGGVTLGAVKE